MTCLATHGELCSWWMTCRNKSWSQPCWGSFVLHCITEDSDLLVVNLTCGVDHWVNANGSAQPLVECCHGSWADIQTTLSPCLWLNGKLSPCNAALQIEHWQVGSHLALRHNMASNLNIDIQRGLQLEHYKWDLTLGCTSAVSHSLKVILLVALYWTSQYCLVCSHPLLGDLTLWMANLLPVVGLLSFCKHERH